MQDPTATGTPRFGAHCLRQLLPLFAALALFAASCSGGARPTVTVDALPATTAEDQTDSGLETETAADPGAAVETTEEPTDATEADDGADSGTTTDDSDTESSDTEGSDTESDGSADSDSETAVEQLVIEVIETFPHDAGAFTQGLELNDGLFVESTGQYGQSDLRRVDPATGEVLQQVAVGDEFFAEGLTRVDDRLIQLTWRENTAFFYDVASFEVVKEVAYTGEGWGLCYDGSRLVMTDGTPVLIFRDPVTFDETSRIPVTLNGEDVYNLNEIECVDGQVWANIWQTELIVRIDPATGAVTGIVDAIEITGPELSNPNAVLNGIAWDASTQTFFVTGKLWPTMYRVNFVSDPAG